MPIYTRKGDAGQTSLNPYTSKTSKASLQIEALGEVDELQAWIGVCRSSSKVKDLNRALQKIQSTLFRVQAHLGFAPQNLGGQAHLGFAPQNLGGQAHIGRDAREKVAVPLLSNDHVKELEAMIAYFEKKLPPLTKFIMSGNSTLGALLQYARTVCRRVERAVVRYQEETIALDPQILQYMNRLSSVLYIMGREADRVSGVQEERPDYYNE